jgi:hypothetical protein
VVDIEFRSSDVSIRTTKSNCIKLLGVTNMIYKVLGLSGIYNLYGVLT